MTTTQFRERAALKQAKLLREGDTIVFEAGPRFDIIVEEVETDSIGHIRVRHDNNTGSSSYHPGELLWVIRRNDAGRTN